VGLRAAHQRLQVLFATDVADARDGLATSRANRVDHLLAGLQLAARHHDPRAMLGQSFCDRATDSAARARDDGHLAVQTKKLH